MELTSTSEKPMRFVDSVCKNFIFLTKVLINQNQNQRDYNYSTPICKLLELVTEEVTPSAHSGLGRILGKFEKLVFWVVVVLSECTLQNGAISFK